MWDWFSGLGWVGMVIGLGLILVVVNLLTQTPAT